MLGWGYIKSDNVENNGSNNNNNVWICYNIDIINNYKAKYIIT